jgi:hypothetical protein
MNMCRGEFKIFAESNLNDYFMSNNGILQKHIEQEKDNYILNVNEYEYKQFLNNKFTIMKPELYFEGTCISDYEKPIPAEYFPPGYIVYSGKSYPKQVIVYHIPISGNIEVLKFRPNTFSHNLLKVFIEERCLCFEIINFNNNPEDIKTKAQSSINFIKNMLDNLIRDIDSYNSSLQISIDNLFFGRKQNILNKNNFLSSLEVPIKVSSNMPGTYAIPTLPLPKIIINKPIVTEIGYKPDPSLDQTIYQQILQIIFDVGKTFERLPSTYMNKTEEEIRDLFLLYLAPRFEGSATGETFNKTGKTDILIRYQNSNAFIAECKFWNGKTNYLKTITQLLGYLTWRDSKAAVIVFVKNKDFSSVIQTVENVTSEHSNYLRYNKKVYESWINYTFHINGDRNREVKLAVILLHVPNLRDKSDEASGD